MYTKPHRPKPVRRAPVHGQHTVPCIAVGVHIFLRYSIIGQHFHRHRRDIIFLVDNVHLPILIFWHGQCPVMLFFLLAAVVHDDFLALVQIEFGIELRLFRQQLL